MSQTYYIFRHGRAVRPGEHYGNKILTAPLLSEYKEPVKRLAEFLKSIPQSRNFSSEIVRCRQTAEIITQVTGKEFIFDSRLNEFYHEEFDILVKRAKLFLEEI